MENKENHIKHFLELVKSTKRGKLKVYIGMSAGVGKSYRMLQEAHALQRNGMDVKIGFIETHGRKETEELVNGLTIIPQRQSFYKGKSLLEMDRDEIISRKPEIVVIDELAHSNIQGSRNEKRWQDVLDILNAGISVITAVNIQHVESLNAEVKKITGVEVAERIPDNLLYAADEVVNIDLPSDELISRLKEGKIYTADKINTALNNFFRSEHILQLRELALRTVASQVTHKVEMEVPKSIALRNEYFMACISTNEQSAKNILRKTARLANYYNSKWLVLYVQTAKESADKINLVSQRHLINNFKLATEMGAQVLKIKENDIAKAINDIALEKNVTTICIGRPHFSLLNYFMGRNFFNKLLRLLKLSNIDIVILN